MFRIIVSNNGFVSSNNIESYYNCDNVIPPAYTPDIFDIETNYYFFEPGETYTFRIFFYNKIVPATAWFDDVIFYGSSCVYDLDVDVDGTPNHLDLNSDGDQCYDVKEAGFTDDNVDGILGDNPVTVDASGKVISGIDGYTAPNLDFLDSSAESCPEICGNGLDDNADGQVDETYPANISENMILWLKADAGFSAMAWEDQSEKGNDATLFGDPSNVANSMNFNGGINFDGDDHAEVSLPELVFDGGDKHIMIFAVYKPSTSSSNIGVFGNQGTNTGTIELYNNFFGVGYGSLLMSSAFGDAPHLITYVIDEEDNVSGSANSSKFYHNGDLKSSVTFNEGNSANMDVNFHIGKSGSFFSSPFFQGDIHELMIYHENNGNVSLSESQRQQIESFLALKYGISLSHDYSDSQ